MRRILFKRQGRILIIALLAVAAALIPMGVLSVSGASSIAVDGSGNAWCGNSTNSCSTKLTTTHSNDISIVYATEALDLQTSCNFNVSDSSGLSWTARSSDVFSIDGRDQIQEFWARSPGVLVSDSVTESILGCGDEYNGIVAFAISGANYGSPFDPNLSLAASAVGNGGVTSVQFSTSNSGDLAIAGSWQHGPGTASAGQGFTMINYNPAGINTAESEILSTPVTNSAASLANIPSDYWMIIADALQSGPTTPPSLQINPTSGPVGTSVLVHGTRIPTSSVEITFDDNFIGTTTVSNSSFSFTLDVPQAQLGNHQIKAVDQSGTFLASTGFVVTPSGPPSLAVIVTVGTIYFPGDTVVASVLVTSNGTPLSSSGLHLRMNITKPDSSNIILNVQPIGNGLFRASYILPKTAQIGTYSVIITATNSTTTNASALVSFEVKLPWLSSQAQNTAIAGVSVASLTAIGIGLVSWRKGYFKRKD